MTTKTNQKKWVKTLQFFAAYLVAAWTLLQFVDWILNRYNISPYWVDILLWFFVGIIPSLLIYLYHYDRINARVLKLREKIIFPLNIVLIFIALYLGFGNNDLGAITKTINYENEQGEQKTALITKEEFRSGFSLYNFEPKTKDSTYAWMEWGISMLLNEDLLQNKNLSPELNGISNTVDKIKNAKIFNPFYIDGEFEVKDSTYTITAFIRNSDDGKIVKKETFVGTDLLNLIDDITIFVTNNFTSNEFNAPKYVDLNVKEFTSNSLKAIEYYRNGDYENAIKEDTTFALAYLASATRNLTFNISKFEERKLADKAYEFRSKLPLQKQGETLIYKNLAYDQFENAETLIKLQLEVDPSDDYYNSLLYNLYGRTKNIKAYTEHAISSFENKKSISNGFYFINACLIKKDYDKILKELNKLELLQPNNDDIFTLKLQPQLFKGDINAASKTLNKIKLLHPDRENVMKVYDKVLAYIKDHKTTKEDLKKFEGEYRSDFTEQTLIFWIENDILLRYVSNQLITPQLMAGDNLLISGASSNQRTWETTFLKDYNNKFYAYKEAQNDFSNSGTFWSWRIDENMKKAESLLEQKKLDSAEVAYDVAIRANPKHYFLKDALAHIQYVKNTDSLTLINQFKDVAGTYGPRKFWMEDGKLFYKREGFPKIELLPVSNNRYINLTKFINQFAFEFLENGKIASYAWRYNNNTDSWDKLDNEGNYFIKED